jgi:uncharacterized protein (TIGR03118 family)
VKQQLKVTAGIAGIILSGVFASSADTSAQVVSNGYRRANLVSDVAGLAVYRDKALVNPWGLATGSAGPYFVANEATQTLTKYMKSGEPVHDAGGRIRIALPGQQADRGDIGPTGVTYSGSPDYVITSGSKTAAAEMIIVTLDGRIAGWSSAVDANSAILLLDNTGSGNSYTGVAVVGSKRGTVLAVANFGNGRLDIFSPGLELTASVTDPGVPAGFAPFNVANIGGELYVTFAMRGEDGREIKGAGLGYVDVFDVYGTLIRRFASGGTLNAPWGIELAPTTFGEFGDQILIGNSGDGRINVYDPVSGEFKGQLEDRFGEQIEIDGLRGLMFGTIGNVGRSNVLYFTAGILDQSHGLLGSLTPR